MKHFSDIFFLSFFKSVCNSQKVENHGFRLLGGWGKGLSVRDLLCSLPWKNVQEFHKNQHVMLKTIPSFGIIILSFGLDWGQQDPACSLSDQQVSGAGSPLLVILRTAKAEGKDQDLPVRWEAVGFHCGPAVYWNIKSGLSMFWCLLRISAVASLLACLVLGVRSHSQRDWASSNPEGQGLTPCCPKGESRSFGSNRKIVFLWVTPTQNSFLLRV